MKKIISVFKRNYETDRLVRDEVVPGAEWVLNGEGIPTEKFDGTACMVSDGVLFKRYDLKPSKKRKRLGPPFSADDFPKPPSDWIACENQPNKHTGHWPGWIPVKDGPEDEWHREAWTLCKGDLENGTYELVGPKIQGNPYKMSAHALIRHGDSPWIFDIEELTTFENIRLFLSLKEVEGIVWHHRDGRMAKIKRKDFGLEWPIKKES